MIGTTILDIPRHAPVDRFEVLRGRILSGANLRTVRQLAESLLRYGLLSPIVAIERGDRLVIIDGRKRLAAIRRLSFEGRLPPSLFRLPYVLSGEASADRRAPMMLASRPLFRDVCDRFQSEHCLDTVAEHFALTRRCVRDILSLAFLAPIVREAFFTRQIDFAQARAFATQPDPKTQTDAFRRLGYKAGAERIVRAMRLQDCSSRIAA